MWQAAFFLVATMNQKLETFLFELSELSRKHGFAIVNGPGCCGNPAVVPAPMAGTYYATEDGEFATDLEWLIGDWN